MADLHLLYELQGISDSEGMRNMNVTLHGLILAMHTSVLLWGLLSTMMSLLTVLRVEKDSRMSIRRDAIMWLFRSGLYERGFVDGRFQLGWEFGMKMSMNAPE